MKLTVKLSTTLRDYVPGYVPETGLQVEMPEGSTVAQLAQHLGLPPQDIKIRHGQRTPAEGERSHARRRPYCLFSGCRRRLGTLAMTISDLHQFFSPYIRAKYPTKPAGDMQETLFVSLEGLRRLWAASQALTLRAAMIYLLGQNIWPERFRRNFGLVTAEEMTRLLHSRVLVLGCGGLGHVMNCWPAPVWDHPAGG